MKTTTTSDRPTDRPTDGPSAPRELGREIGEKWEARGHSLLSRGTDQHRPQRGTSAICIRDLRSSPRYFGYLVTGSGRFKGRPWRERLRSPVGDVPEVEVMKYEKVCLRPGVIWFLEGFFWEGGGASGRPIIG